MVGDDVVAHHQLLRVLLRTHVEKHGPFSIPMNHSIKWKPVVSMGYMASVVLPPALASCAVLRAFGHLL